MDKEVILMSDVEGLGLAGDVVKVASGYARNFLLPKSLAAPVTQATRRQLEKKQKELLALRAEQRKVAEELAKRIAAASCTITVKTGEEGKLYGSVTAMDVAAALKAQGVEIDKSKIVLEEAIRELGVFNLAIKLDAGVQATVKVWIVEE